MALVLDVSRPLRGIDGRRALVRAIVAAHPNDETDWLEWKSDLDLNSKPGCFHVARAILGMSNRPVEVAGRHCGGHGYLVVGAEPGRLKGVLVPDPAQWIPKVEMYLKRDVGPAWEWMTVPVEGRDVLVITVDPPQDGDPIWPLRRELENYRSGTLFVRKSGRTEPALAEDVDALAGRLHAGGSKLPQLVVEVIGDIPVPWLRGTDAGAHVGEWVDRVRDRLLRAAQAVEGERLRSSEQYEPSDGMSEPGSSAAHLVAEQAQMRRAFAEAMRAIRLSSLMPAEDESDTRSFAEYVAELDAWAAASPGAALADLLRCYCEAGFGLVHLRVTNNSTQYLPGVEVRLHIPFEKAKGFEQVPDGDHVPRPPRAYGQPRPSPKRTGLLLHGLAQRIEPVGLDHLFANIRDTTVEDGSIHVTLDAGELRPTATHDGDDFYIFLPARPADGALHAHWTATVQHRDGIIEGDLRIPVQEQPVDVFDLLTQAYTADLEATDHP